MKKIKTYNIFCNEEHEYFVIDKECVKRVADFLSVSVSEDEINWAIWNFDSYAKDDPDGTWRQIIETMIENVIIPNRDDPDWMKDDLEKYKEFLINQKADKYNL